MDLYYSPGACSLAPHIALSEAGAKHGLKKVDLKAKKVEDGSDFYAVNSKGYVPTLKLDDGSVMTEVPVLLQYIADAHPESNLAPKFGTKERWTLMEALNFVTAELHKGFGPLFNPAMPQEAKDAAVARLSTRFDWLDKHLAGKDYMMGKAFSVVDGYLYTILRWATAMKIDLAKWPAIAAFKERVAARPKVKAALAAEGLS